MEDLFYPLGIALVVVAATLSIAGMRSEKFPGSRGLLFGVIAGMAVLVAATAGFAIALSAKEKKDRNAELALEEKPAETAANDTIVSTAGGEGDEAAQNSQTGAPAGAETGSPDKGGVTVKLSSPESGDLVYDETKLSAKPGPVTIAYTNPSPVPHSVALEDSGGKSLAEGQIVSGGDTSDAAADVKPGTYTYFCTVPGHRQAGMEGTLTVK